MSAKNVLKFDKNLVLKFHFVDWDPCIKYRSRTSATPLLVICFIVYSYDPVQFSIIGLKCFPVRTYAR